jgi:hypothetical protein
MDRQVFLISFKSRLISPDRLFSWPCLKQGDKTGLKPGQRSFDRFFIKTGSCLDTLFCLKTCQRLNFLSLNPRLSSCFKQGPEKSLSRETSLDLKLRNEKPVRKPVFCKQIPEARK